MNFGDVIEVDFGTPVGSEAGFLRPAVVCTADAFLRFRPTTVIVAPLTTTRRTFPSHIEVAPDTQNQLATTSYILVEQLRAVSAERCSPTNGNVGAVMAHQITEIIAMIIGIP
jgi:mRNA interferase MazF